jgi:hypothetical protein
VSAPRVSVLLPVRDGAPFLAEAVESILSQTLGDLELVAVDDGSRDGSDALLESLARRDPRLCLVRQPARGMVAALNRGLAEARGALVARLDQDDVALPDRLARQAAFLDRHPRVALVCGGAIAIDAAGREHYRLRPPRSDAALRAALARGNCVLHPSVMLRAEAVRAAGGYRAAFLHAEDHDLWLRLAERHALAGLTEPVLRYRVHASQTSHRFVEQQVWSSLAAATAARRRRAGLDEGLSPHAPVTSETLAALGVAPQELARAFAVACAARAADLSELDRPDLAEAALAQAAGAGVPRRELRARHQLARARRAWSGARRGRALLAALAATRDGPALVGAAAGAWLMRVAR